MEATDRSQFTNLGSLLYPQAISPDGLLLVVVDEDGRCLVVATESQVVQGLLFPLDLDRNLTPTFGYILEHYHRRHRRHHQRGSQRTCLRRNTLMMSITHARTRKV